VADGNKQVFRIVIDGSQEAIWRELTSTDRPLGAIYNSRMHTTGLRPGGRMQMRTVSGGHVIVDGDILEYSPPNRFVHTHRFTSHEDPVCRHPESETRAATSFIKSFDLEQPGTYLFRIVVEGKDHTTVASGTAQVVVLRVQ